MRRLAAARADPVSPGKKHAWSTWGRVMVHSRAIGYSMIFVYYIVLFRALAKNIFLEIPFTYCVLM